MQTDGEMYQKRIAICNMNASQFERASLQLHFNFENWLIVLKPLVMQQSKY